MRLKRNYFRAAGRFFDWFISRFKPLTVHTEAIMDDLVWEKIKEKVKNKKVSKWYIMTPMNYEYYKVYFNIKNSKQEIFEIMKKRYKWMIEHGQKLELHIHLSIIIKNMTYAEQKKLFKESIDWMRKELNIEVKEFVPGWWAYDVNTLKILKEFNLKLIKEKDYDYIHDYTWAL